MKSANILGLVVFSISALCLIVFGIYKAVGPFFTDQKIPLPVKLGISGITLGVIIILVSLIFERIRDKSLDDTRDKKK